MSKKSLLILGAGQYGQVVRETAEAMGCFSKIAFLDDNSPLAIGKMAEYDLPVLIHPKAYVSPSALLGKATIVEPLAVVNTGAVVEQGGLLCAGCVVNHNAHVMPVCQIDCNAIVASNATVPEGTKVCSGVVYERK